MKKMFIVFTLMFICGITYSQKMYIWCPNDLTSSSQEDFLKGDEINILIADSRLFSSKLKNKCSKEELITSINSLITSTFSNVIFTKSDKAIKDVKQGDIYIELDILAYYATFTSTVWYATTTYSVKVIDFRGAKLKEFKTKINKEKKSFNIGGLATAKNNLNKSYIEANIDLIDFISDNL